jgi:protein SCO1/2
LRAALIAAIALGILGCQGPPPPVMATIPVFSLTSAQGETFKSDALVGQPYVASFFFTSCQTICPVVMNGVRGTLSKADAAGIPLRAISITVDPDNDTPERLFNYQAKETIDAARWTLLTGDHATLHKVVVEGFMAYMGKREETEGGLFDIGHEARLMLIDHLGRLRGLFEADEPGQAALINAAKRL